MHTLSSRSKPFSFFRAFRDHPASVGETYFGHMAFALGFSGKLLFAGFAALIHAFIPPLFETTASRIIREQFQRMENRTGTHR